jgi:hypothetical protein
MVVEDQSVTVVEDQSVMVAEDRSVMAVEDRSVMVAEASSAMVGEALSVTEVEDRSVMAVEVWWPSEKWVSHPVLSAGRLELDLPARWALVSAPAWAGWWSLPG